jgi:glycolate oxidase
MGQNDKIMLDAIAYFSSIIGIDNVLLEDEQKKKYGRDMTEGLFYMPSCVLKPKNTEEVSKILSYANNNYISIVPQGRRTCLSGGALPINGAVVLSLENLNRILEIDEENYTVTVEPYVVNFELRTAVEAKGLFYPPDPASFRISSIGGNLAENAGGPRCVKYGTTKDYCLSMEVVLADGSIINTGKPVLKNVTGYNLTQLFIGSEGTLGVITKATLRLIPKPAHDTLMIISFKDLVDACKAVNVILGAGVIPSALELMERNCLLASQAHTKTDFPQVTEETEAHLIVEFDGTDLVTIQAQRSHVAQILQSTFTTIEYLFQPNTDEEVQKVWSLRRVALIAAKKISEFKDEDIVVPRSNLPKAISYVRELSKEFGLGYVAWGHAGDGNLHVCVMQNDMEKEKFEQISHVMLEKLFKYISNDLSGTISGEHGIGLVQKDFVPLSIGAVELDIMHNIKKVLDPHNILNPGKALPERN